jgi:hypothetical protein
MKSPYIHEAEKEYLILGSREALIALGEMLIQKGRMGRQLSATFSDGINKPIHIMTDDDVLENFNALEKARNKDAARS